MLETTKPGNSIPVETCFSSKWKISAYFCLLSSAERNLFENLAVSNGAGIFVPDNLGFCNFY